MQEEVATVELVDATDPGEHNDTVVVADSEAGLVSRTIPLDDSTSQANVSIRQRAAAETGSEVEREESKNIDIIN